MPSVILSSKLSKTDSVYLENWIQDAISEHYHQRIVSGHWLPVPFLIGSLPASFHIDLELVYSLSLNPDYKRFVRVLRFHKVENYNVYATVRDSHQLVLCHFTSKCVMDYEANLQERITYNSVNTLFVIGNVTLEFWNARDSFACFGVEFPHLRMVPVLKVEQACIFDRDQVSSALRYSWVYDHLNH